SESKIGIDMEEMDLVLCRQINSRSPGARGVLYLFMTAAFLLTISGNLAIIVSISYFKQLQSPTNFLILSMACHGFPTGLCHYALQHGEVRGELFHFPPLFHCCGSLLCNLPPSALCLSDDHECHKTNNSKCAGQHPQLLLLVLFSQKLMLLELRCGELFYLQLVYLLPACVMIGIYCKIFVVSQKHVCELSQAHKHTKSDMKNELSKSKDRKAARTLSVVMLGFLICWFPCFFAILIDPFLNFSTPVPLFDALTWLGYLNSLCNPLIYGFFYPWFRKALKYIVTGKIFNSQFRTTKLVAEEHSH
uniref:Trace amine associated receptor 2 (gene/pseudogene) n=1 Tax=Anas platyrhynchos TaxID=8839 RepID=A0A8B9SPJ0_ANAPL